MTGTKIIATVGPASDSDEIISELIGSGVNIFRFNLKYNTYEWHQKIINHIDSIRQTQNNSVAILIDIPGLEKAPEWLDLTKEGNIDFVALSYIHSPDDVITLKSNLAASQSKARLIAKIETAQALNSLESIIRFSDGIMVARGDLGTELPIEEIPYHQKYIIKRSLEIGKPVITATEMLESMIDNPIPTRAEVSDVANAMYDATDAVMLSAETAIGKYPLEAVKIMRKVASYIDSKRPNPLYNYQISSQTEALAMAANDLARQKTIESQKINAFLVITESGDTVRALSRLRPQIPVIAVTPHNHISNQLLLSWGVTSIVFEKPVGSYDEQKQKILEKVTSTGLIYKGNHLIMLYGNEVGASGTTNVIRIEKV